jgi:translation elongation factor EF-1alpha
MTKEKQIGVVSNYFDHVKVAAIKLTSGLKIGDVIKFVGGEIDFDQPIESMQIHHDQVENAKQGDEIGIKVKEKVRKGYKFFKVESSE